MVVGRRGLLKLFGAAPLAAKVARDEAIANLTSLRGAPIGFGGPSSSFPPSSAQANEIEPISSTKKVSRLFSFLRRFGLPDWELERIRRDYRSVFSLDPDIAALRSFSMSVKIGMQRERNIERAIEGLKGHHLYSAHMEKFQKRHGFWLWY